jgi:hypothetical protein
MGASIVLMPICLIGLWKSTFHIVGGVTRFEVLAWWTVVLGDAILSGVLWWRYLRWRVVHCVCGYDLSGLQTDHCPECDRRVQII